MDTHKFKVGWAIVTTEGLIPKETAKLRRKLVSKGAHKLVPNTYALSGVRGLGGLKTLVSELRAMNTKETTFRAIYVTRSQWERGFISHGISAS